MVGVVSGILIVSAVIAVGYLAARLRILGPGALTRTAFYVTNPALLFTVVAGSDIRAALGTDAPLALLSAAAAGLLYCPLSSCSSAVPSPRQPSAQWRAATRTPTTSASPCPSTP